MNHILSQIEAHATKVGFGGTFLALTLSQWSALVSIAAGLATLLCLVPVAVTRWRKMWRGDDAE